MLKISRVLNGGAIGFSGSGFISDSCLQAETRKEMIPEN
jgi:agmatine/peptidylarginine deiminase